jgi:hypothetical protein
VSCWKNTTRKRLKMTRFLNICLLRYAYLFRTHAWVWFQHTRVWILHAECDFYSQEWDFDTLKSDLYTHACVLEKYNTQKFENDTFACKIHTHACRFLNIFLLEHGFFSEQFQFQHTRVGILNFTRSGVIFTRRSVILTWKVWMSHSQV